MRYVWGTAVLLLMVVFSIWTLPIHSPLTFWNVWLWQFAHLSIAHLVLNALGLLVVLYVFVFRFSQFALLFIGNALCGGFFILSGVYIQLWGLSGTLASCLGFACFAHGQRNIPYNWLVFVLCCKIIEILWQLSTHANGLYVFLVHLNNDIATWQHVFGIFFGVFCAFVQSFFWQKRKSKNT